jgi:putative transcriptional regulator
MPVVPVPPGCRQLPGCDWVEGRGMKCTCSTEAIKQSIDWDRQHAMTDAEIDQAIADDPDASPLTETEGMALRLQSVRRCMNLSQSEFAERFHIPVATLRDWEQARRRPDATVWAYIQVIDREPDAVLRALKAGW